MKLVVEKAALEQLFRGRRANETAGYAHPAEADIVKQNEEDVRGTLWGLLVRREVRPRLRRIHFNLGVRKLPLGLGQVVAVEMNGIRGAFLLRHNASSSLGFCLGG
jgi:hypothetical protein